MFYEECYDDEAAYYAEMERAAAEADAQAAAEAAQAEYEAQAAAEDAEIVSQAPDTGATDLCEPANEGER